MSTPNSNRTWRSLLRSTAVCGALLMIGCASPTQRTDREAQRAGLARSIVQGTSFHHLIYMRATAPVATLRVYLEGDGIPWIGGRAPAADPTSRNPLALRLMIQSREPAMYVGRPCYLEVQDTECSARAWTFARYSQQTVESMASVIDAKSKALGAASVQLIGYSGGGVLAVLIAERLPNVSSVVTIAANLDIDAWAAHHDYLPLRESLNPASSASPHLWRELHLQGARDTTVPIATTKKYFERFSAAQQLQFETFDHACCWLEQWSDIENKIRAEAR